MTANAKPLLRALAGETLPTPPVWLMRQAGRYLPEYRATREHAGSFLDLCYNPDLATEVTLQPIRRFGFDAAILFADILLVPQALGADLRFVQGEGPRLSTIESAEDLARLGPVDAIHETLSPVYETVSRLSSALPAEVTLIGFAGSPWTVATYMIAGRGTPNQEPARRLLMREPEVFFALLDRITEATIEYLSRQVEAGAEAVKLFDSWAGSLSAPDFGPVCLEPNRRIILELKSRFPDLPVIAFPRGAGGAYERFVAEAGADCVALDQHVPADWARERLQPHVCVQGNLDPMLMVEGGDRLDRAARDLCETLGGGPFVFNLGHGITPDADPANVERLIRAIRG
ncbi:MAG: uroporphyrinogen decarboxylase [Pseudomonadota bacterium]|nr:uroporphyrinogen decarboxylase [Pseudomonadota bacterium]